MLNLRNPLRVGLPTRTVRSAPLRCVHDWPIIIIILACLLLSSRSFILSFIAQHINTVNLLTSFPDYPSSPHTRLMVKKYKVKGPKYRIDGGGGEWEVVLMVEGYDTMLPAFISSTSKDCFCSIP